MTVSTDVAVAGRTPAQTGLYWLRRGFWMEIWGYVSIYRFVCRRPRVPAGASAFTYHQPVLLVIGAFILMSTVELVVLDLFLRRWPTVRIAVLALSVWGLVWMFGMLFGFLTRPHAVGPTGIRVRSGAEVDLALDWDLVESVTRNKQTVQSKQPHISVHDDGTRALHLRMQDATNIDVQLREPLAVKLPQGRETVSRISLFADQPDAFMSSVREHSTASAQG